MTARRTKKISFFCEPGELVPILKFVLGKTETKFCRAEEREECWLFRYVDPTDRAQGDIPQFYTCHPEMLRETGLDSLTNIVQLWMPVRRSGELRMGEVSMLIAESELEPRFRELQQEVYKALRRELTRRFERGVWGRNSNTGGEHFYRDILISKNVRNVARGGLALKPQFGDGFVTFSPDRTQ